MNQYFFVFIKGLAMGAADVVPGVSGGTVAFITGIYERLLTALSRVDVQLFSLLRKWQIKSAWQYLDGSFLVVLFSGVLSSILSLAKIITFLLAQYPILVWAFFFGLILASALYIIRQIPKWNASVCIAVLIGIVIAVLITSLKPADIVATPYNVFFAGAIAICAMILPGVSGSFLLLMMGLYQPILTAIKQADLVLLGCFAAGAGIGLLSFAKFLNYLLARFHNITLAFLTGFLFGSLKLVWPWKQTLTFYESRHGLKPLEQQNVSPWLYEQITQQGSLWPQALALAVFAVVFVLGLEYFARDKQGN